MYIRVKICQHQQDISNKYIVDFIPQYHRTIEQFLNRVIELCSLDTSVDNLQISDQGYTLPHLLSTNCLSDQKVYKIWLKNQSNKK